MPDPNSTAAPAQPAQPAGPSGQPIRIVRCPGGVPNLNEAFEELAKHFPAEMVKLRMPLQLWDPAKRNYEPVANNFWRLEFQSAEEAVLFRERLAAFIDGYVTLRQSGA